MSTITRVHLAGLELLLEILEFRGGVHYMTQDHLKGLIAQASAAPEQGPEIPSGAIHNGQAFLDRVEQLYQFRDEHGHPLINCSDYQEARRCFEHLAEHVSTHADPSEVARLRAACEKEFASVELLDHENQKMRQQLFAATQRADAAERQVADLQAQFVGVSLARDAAERKLGEAAGLLARVVNSGALSAEQHEELEADICAAVDVVATLKKQDFADHLESEAEKAIAMPDYKRECVKSPAHLSATAQPAECDSCEPAGVFATDGSGPYDCPDCGKKAAAQMPGKEAGSQAALGVDGAARPAEGQTNE